MPHLGLLHSHIAGNCGLLLCESSGEKLFDLPHVVQEGFPEKLVHIHLEACEVKCSGKT